MKPFNQYNFFKHTFCEFLQVEGFSFPEKGNYKSKSDSTYTYSKEGVYRKSNHWGRVANCRWKLIANEKYKNQNTVIGFAKWNHFYPINTLDKIFFIEVDFHKHIAQIKPKETTTKNHFYTYTEASKRKKQITHLFKDKKWASYFDLDIEELRKKIITTFVNSDRDLSEIKRQEL